ncbi:MAG: sulfatase-like hydrolase/transferase [Sulfuricurvum sp.]|jgi:phosphoglycerol transferase MdoB-like AlkP superfamily enzyme|nr:sulfatase-like hydrolase/transferase [Sulfuricurvum sp.]
MTFTSRYTQVFSALAISLAAMMLPRIFLFLLYPADFSDLTFSELITSFLTGFRVDIITIFTFLSLFIVLLTFPAKWVHKKRFRIFMGIVWSCILSIVLLISFSDVLYYDFVHRHISNELFALSNDTDLIIGMAFGSYLYHTIAAGVFFSALAYLFFKIFSARLSHEVVSKKSWIAFLAIALLLFIGIRNSFSHKSFGISDAYAVNKTSSGNLALNGFFCVYRTAGAKSNPHNLADLNTSVKLTQTLLQSDNAPFIDPSVPLSRAFSTTAKKPHYNVVIVLLESWGAEHIDGFTRYKELGVTPYFKKLSDEGLKFTNFYANGYRSIYGITSIYTGLTLPAGYQYLGSGLELSKLSYLGKIAQENGYRTIAMQSSNRRSYRVDAVSNLAGFEEYYGAEDMPKAEQVDPGRRANTGTFDYNMFYLLNQKLNQTQKPFLAFAFTSTNHSDYLLPSAKFERYPHDLRNYYGTLNSYIYVDNAIERFMEAAKKQPWFDNTIFIFTADHGRGDGLCDIGKKLRPDDKPLASIEHNRIPLIIYAPKIFKPQVIPTLGSQNDIFPTILDMLGFSHQPFTVMGNSLLDTSVKNRFVYLYLGDEIGYIEKEGYVKHNFKTVVETNASTANTALLTKKLLAVDTAEAGLLTNNHWAK